MRIVYLNPCGKLGGAETSLRELLASVRSAAPEWELWLVLGEDGPLAEIARGAGVQVVVRPFPSSLSQLGDSERSPSPWAFLTAAAATIRYGFELRGLLRRIKPDIIHSTGFKMHLLSAWFAPKQPRLIWHIHDYVSSRRSMSGLLRLFDKACSVAIVNSRSVAADVSPLFPGLRVTTIYNAIDLRRFSPAGKNLDLDSAAGLPAAAPGTIRVGLVATFARWKGHKVFLDALTRIPSEIPIRGYIVGGPIYQTKGSQWSVAELKEECSRLGLAGKVGLTGFLEDTAAAMRSLDIVVHASTEPEPFGMVIIEGMACGKAVIASQAGGAAELIADGENAVPHAPGDAAGLARQIELLARDPKLREKLGQGGRSTAERFYDGKRLGKELVDLYHEVARNVEQQRRYTAAMAAPDSQ